jgi:surfeit locus 1 family protein
MNRRIIAPLAFGLCGVAVLLALGFWQLRRLEWKEAILADIAARIEAAPVNVPEAPTEAGDEYQRVVAAGALEEGEIHVYTSAPPKGVGYRVIAPLRLDDGRRILVDRGFVPVGAKDAPRSIGPVTVEGVLLWPNETDGWTAPPDPEKNVWIARDVGPMAEALGTLPILVVAGGPAPENPAEPAPIPVGVNVPNDHLGYAVTWFSLAVVWAVMTALLLWRIKRRTD